MLLSNNEILYLTSHQLVFVALLKCTVYNESRLLLRSTCQIYTRLEISCTDQR